MVIFRPKVKNDNLGGLAWKHKRLGRWLQPFVFVVYENRGWLGGTGGDGGEAVEGGLGEGV